MTEENKTDEKARREKLLELQTLDGQIKQLEDQLVNIENQVYEINIIIESLIELSKLNNGNELLVPVANGIFVKAKLEDSINLKVNVGANNVVEKTNEETQNMLKEQIRTMEQYKDEMFLELQNLVNKASFIQAEVVGGKN